MDGNLNYQFINGMNISGQSILEQAISDALGGLNKLEQDLDAQNHKIFNLGTATQSSEATNLGLVQFLISQAQIDPAQLPPLNAINDIVPLDGNLDLQGSYNVLVNNQSLGSGFQAVNRNHIISNNAAERLITDADIATGVQEAKDYALAQDALLQTDLEQYVDNEISTLTTYVNNQDAILQSNIDTVAGRSLDQIASLNPTQEDISMGGFKITNIGAPTNPNDVSSKGYTDTQITTTNSRTIGEISTQNNNNSDINTNGYNIYGLPQLQTNDDQATSKFYVDIKALQAENNAKLYCDDKELNSFPVNEDLSMNNYSILNLKISGLPSSAATVGEVNTISQTVANTAESNANQYTNEQISDVNDTISTLASQVGQNIIDIQVLEADVADQRDKIKSPNDQIYVQTTNDNIQINADSAGKQVIVNAPDLIIRNNNRPFTTGQINSLNLSVSQQNEAGKDTIGIIQVTNENKSSIDFGAVCFQENPIALLPNGQTNVDSASFLQCLQLPVNSTNTAFVISSGQALVDNSILISNEPTVNIRTMFNQKAGYQSGIQVTENDQFATKKYVDDNAGGGGNVNNPLESDLDGDAQYTLTNIRDPVANSDVVNLGYLDNQLAGYLPVSTSLDEINAPTASLDLNSQKIVNLLDPTLAQDAATKAYVDSNSGASDLSQITVDTSLDLLNTYKVINCVNPTNDQDAATKAYVDSVIPSISPALFYNETITTLTNGSIYQVNHNLNRTFFQLDVKGIIIIKSGVSINGFGSDELIDIAPWQSDISDAGQSHGWGAVSVSPNAIRIVCGSLGVANIRRSGGTTSNSTDINWNQVNLLLYITERQNPLILQANAINSSNITIDSGLDFATGGFRVSGADPVSGSDYVTKTYGDANYSGGGGGLPSNSTLNSIATTNPTSANVSMNGFKLTGLALATSNGDAVSYQQLNKIFSPSTLNSVECTDSQIRIRKTGRSDYMTIATGINTISMDGDEIQLYANGQIMQVLTSAQNRFTRKLKLSGTSTSVGNALYIDQSLVTSGSTVRIVGNASTDVCLEVNTGKIQHSGTFISSGDIQVNFPNEALYIRNSDVTVVPDPVPRLTMFYTNQPGVYGIDTVSNYIRCGQVDIYVPSSSRQFKKDITPINTTGLLDINFKRFYYDKEAGALRGMSLDDSRENYGVIIEELPQECERYIINKENGVQSVKLTELKDDLIQALLEKVRDLESRLSVLEARQ